MVTVLGNTHALCTVLQSRRLKQLVNVLKLPSSVIPKQESMQRRQHQEKKICFKRSFVYIWLHHLRVIVSKSSGFVRNTSQDDDLRTWHGKQIFMVVAKNWGVVSKIKSSCKVLKQEF